MAKKWCVVLPVAGSIEFEVEAETKNDAIEAAMNMPPEKGELTWETFHEIVQGNVCHAPVNKAFADEIDSDD